jgi:hypothetical protein
MASGKRCDECGKLMAVYLACVTRHSELFEESEKLLEDEDPGDINWLIRQAEWRVSEARKAFLTHRAKHSRR